MRVKIWFITQNANNITNCVIKSKCIFMIFAIHFCTKLSSFFCLEHDSHYTNEMLT